MARPEVKVRITANNETAAGLQSVENSLKRIQSTFRTLGAAISLAAVGQFLRRSIQESNDAEAALTRLQVAVQNAGGDFGKLQPRMDAATTSLQRLTRFSDDEGRAALATMITLTGKVDGSLRNLGLAADIATKTQKPLAEAAQIVGLAMDGNVKGLKQLGIQVKDSATALDELRSSYRGFAEEDAKTAQGRLAQLAVAFRDVQEAIGDLLKKIDADQGGSSSLVGFFRSLTKAINENMDAIVRWAKTIGAVIALPVRLVWNAFTVIIRGMAKTLADLVVFAGNLINTFLAGPINKMLDAIEKKTGVSIPFRALVVDVKGAAEVSDQFSQEITQDWKDIEESIGNAILAVLGYGETVDATGKKTRGAQNPFVPQLPLGHNEGPLQDPSAVQGGPGPTYGQYGGPQPSVLGPGGGNIGAGRSPWGDQVDELTKQLKEQMATGITEALTDGIANGFAAALGKGGIKAGFKALANTLLSGLGNAMVAFGKASLLASTLMESIKKSLASFLPGGAIAASIAMIAIGGLLSGAASSAFGSGGGGGSGSGYSARGYTDTITRITVSPTAGSQSASGLTPLRPLQFVVIGQNDPVAQRQIGEMVRKADARNV